MKSTEIEEMCHNNIRNILQDQDILQTRRMNRLNKLLQYIFEIGYDDDAPKWYWMAVRRTLEAADEIINYIPDEEFEDYDLQSIQYFFEKDIELSELELYDNDTKFSELTMIESCWKLLDIFYSKLDEKNLFNVKKGFLFVFARICRIMANNYDN